MTVAMSDPESKPVPPTPPRSAARPLVPLLLLGGLLILLLSWLFFMIHSVRGERYKHSLQAPPPAVQTNTPAP